MTHHTIANPYQDVLRALVDGHKVFLADGPDQWMPQSAGDVLRQISRGTYPPESYRVDKTPSEAQSDARSVADELLAAIDGPMRNPPHYSIRQAAHLLRRLQTENEVLAARLDSEVAKSGSLLEVDWWLHTVSAELDGIETPDENNCLSATKGALAQAMSVLSSIKVSPSKDAICLLSDDGKKCYFPGLKTQPEVESRMSWWMCFWTHLESYDSFQSRKKVLLDAAATTPLPLKTRSADLSDAAASHAALYEGDDRQDIKTDVINAFCAGATWECARSHLGKGAKSTLDDYKKLVEDADPGSPIERLRLFCSLAMRGQDWLDVEPLFTEVSHQVAVSQTVKELVDHTAQEKQATPPAEYWDAFIDAWKKEIGVDEVVSLLGGVQKLRAVYLRAAQGVS